MSAPTEPGGPTYEPVPGLDAELDGVVLRLTLDDPDRRNALTDVSLDALLAHLDRARTDDRVRSVAVTGRGDHFCGGFDLAGRNAPRDSDAPKPRVGSIQRRVPAQAHRLLPTLLELQVPVVCAVRGWAVGIGFQLALGADVCVAADDARFWEPFTTRGFTPDGGATWVLPRLVGVARAKELLLLGRELSGAEAAEWGLITRSVPAAELDEVAAEVTDRLATGPTVALGLTSWLVGAGLSAPLTQQLANEAFALELSSRSPDFREGLRALAERRDPHFGGR